jgi:hypothetical protein
MPADGCSGDRKAKRRGLLTECQGLSQQSYPIATTRWLADSDRSALRYSVRKSVEGKHHFSMIAARLVEAKRGAE